MSDFKRIKLLVYLIVSIFSLPLYFNFAPNVTDYRAEVVI